MTAPEVFCQGCGTPFGEGPTGRDRDRYERKVCGACDVAAAVARASEPGNDLHVYGSQVALPTERIVS